MKKPKIFSLSYALSVISSDPFQATLQKNANFAINSLGTQHRNTKLYVDIFLKHWAKNGVDGHFIPMEGIGANPTGYADFRKMLHGFARMLLGAKTTREVAIANDQSSIYTALFRWLAEEQQRKYRTTILYEKSAFYSDKLIISTVVDVINLNTTEDSKKLRMVPIPETNLGIIDYPKLMVLIKETGHDLGVVAFGSGGVHWKTAELLEFKTIGGAVKEAGGKLLVNIAHAIGIADLQLHDANVTAAVGCSYKFLAGGPGGPSLVFIHEDQSVENLLPVGWFSTENPIATLQGIASPIKKGAQRIEASNPQVLAWLPFLAAAEEHCSKPPETVAWKVRKLLKYSDELMAAIQDNFDSPIVIITPKEHRATEYVFTTTDRSVAPKLCEYLNAKGATCDMRDGDRIRIGMYSLVTSIKHVRKLYYEMWNFFEKQNR